MKRQRLRTVLAAGAAAASLLCVPARAALERLDDSASPRAQVRSDFANAQGMDGHMLVLPLGRAVFAAAE